MMDAIRSYKMSKSCNFDFENSGDLFNALDSLRVKVSTSSTKERTDHLEPLVNASNRSTGRMGRLTKSDISKMRDLGRCTHNKLLVLLLEPTKQSDDTVQYVDSFLQWASCGTLNRFNTAIIDCRALVPNASFNDRYKDTSAYV